MNQNFISIIINIVSSGIVLIIALTWNKWIIPWFKSLVYKGIKINGTWKVEQQTDLIGGGKLSVKRTIDIIIDQSANDLKGSATSRITENLQPDDCEVIYYNVKGEIRDRFISLTFTPKEQNKIAYSVFLLEAIGDGSILRGYRSFYGYKKTKVCVVCCDLKKIKD